MEGGCGCGRILNDGQGKHAKGIQRRMFRFCLYTNLPISMVEMRSQCPRRNACNEFYLQL